MFMEKELFFLYRRKGKETFLSASKGKETFLWLVCECSYLWRNNRILQSYHSSVEEAASFFISILWKRLQSNHFFCTEFFGSEKNGMGLWVQHGTGQPKLELSQFAFIQRLGRCHVVEASPAHPLPARFSSPFLMYCRLTWWPRWWNNQSLGVVT